MVTKNINAEKIQGTLDGVSSISSTTISATTFYGDGSNLTGINSDNYYTTGATLNGYTAFFDRNDSLSAYTLDLSSLSGIPDTNTFVTGFTYNENKFEISDNNGGIFNAIINSMTGLTVNGDLSTTTINVFGDSYLGGGVTASTLDIVNLGTGTSVSNLGIDSNGRVVAGTIGGGTFTGGTVTEPTNFTAGLTVNSLTADTISATTYLNLLGSFGLTVDGAGSVITSGIKGYAVMPYNATITGWDIIGDVSGSCSVDIWKNTTVPTSANTITGSEIPTLTNQQINSDNNLTTWSTGILINDIIAFNVISASTVSRINLIIKVIKT